MKNFLNCIAGLFWLAAGAASAALPALAADSAALDRSYIPALMLSNGKDQAKAQAALAAYDQAWLVFAERQRKAYRGEAGWTRTLAIVDQANARARADVAAGKLADAHSAQEDVRHALWHQRQAMGVAYQPDALTDFHATMELIIASTADKAPQAIDAAAVAQLRTHLAAARTQWQAVKSAQWAPADYGIEGARLDAYLAAVAAEERALDELAAALDAADGARIVKAAPALKPPFARAYAAFGAFPQ